MILWNLLPKSKISLKHYREISSRCKDSIRDRYIVMPRESPSVNQSVSQSVNQPTNQPPNQPANQSINQSIKSLFNLYIALFIQNERSAKCFTSKTQTPPTRHHTAVKFCFLECFESEKTVPVKWNLATAAVPSNHICLSTLLQRPGMLRRQGCMRWYLSSVDIQRWSSVDWQNVRACAVNSFGEERVPRTSD